MTSVDGLSPSVLDALQRLGLTEYGARCYAALVGMDAAEAATIADAADVPRTKVYGVLKQLVDAGWVRAEGGRPARYRAEPPESRVREAEKEIADSAAGAVRELQARQELGAQMIPTSMYLLKGAPLIRQKTLDLVRRARRDLLVVAGFLLPGEARDLAHALERARERGVQVRLLVADSPLFGPIEGLEHFRAFLPGARRSPFPFRGTIADFQQAVVVIPQPGKPPEEVLGMWNPTESFIQMIAPVLLAAWEGAPAYDAAER